MAHSSSLSAAVWRHIRLPSGQLTGLYWSALYGAYVNWAATCFAAAAGTNSMIASCGRRIWRVVLEGNRGNRGFVSVGIAMLTAAGLSLWAAPRPCQMMRYSKRHSRKRLTASSGATHSNSGNWCLNQVNCRLA